MNKSNGNRSREFMMPFGTRMIYTLLRPSIGGNKVCANQWGDSNIPIISSPNEQKCLIRWKTATKHCRGSRAPSSALVVSWHQLHPANLHGPTRQTDKAAVGWKGAQISFWGIAKILVDDYNMQIQRETAGSQSLQDPSMPMSWWRSSWKWCELTLALHLLLICPEHFLHLGLF